MEGERLDVSFEILGTGEIDAEALNRFHGAHFGDEVETEDVADLDQPEEEVVEEEAAEFQDMNWREDVLLRVMKAHDIEDRDGFLAHAMAFDSDDNGYLKKAELENAAKAWNPSEEVVEEAAEEVAEEVVEEVAEEVVEEATGTEMPIEEVAEEVVEEAAEESEGDKSCPICSTENTSDSSACSACGFSF
jgi:hypothetical protein